MRWGVGMKYFETLFKVNPLKVELDAPLVLQETAIIKDTVDDKILLRNIFVNVGNQDIVAIAIKGTLKDIFGENVKYNGQDEFTYVYQDIICEPNTLFGNKISIDLPHDARKIEAVIEKVVLLDGTVWKSNPEDIVTIQRQHEIEASDEFINSYDTNSILPIFYYVENDSCWQCTCGQVNKVSDEHCKKCAREKTEAKKKYSKEYLTEEYNLYAVQKRKEREEIERLKQEKVKEEKVKLDNLPERTGEHIERKRRRKRKRETVNSYKNKHNSIQQSFWRKYNYEIMLGIIICIALVSLAILHLMSNGFDSQEALLNETKKELEPYIEWIGKETENDTASVSQEFIDNLDNVKIMDIAGTVSHGYTDTSGDTIALMDWKSNTNQDIETYNKFTDFLNIYFDWEADSETFDNITDGECLVWSDTEDNCWVIGWYENSTIYLRWYDKEEWNFIPDIS